MALYKSEQQSSGGANVKTGRFLNTSMKTNNYRIELGFRPRYISIIGFQSPKIRGCGLIYNADEDANNTMRGYYDENGQHVTVNPIGDSANALMILYSIDNTGFTIKATGSIDYYVAGYLYYTAIG